MFMLVSLGMLVRTRVLMQTKRFENLLKENKQYKEQLSQTSQPTQTEEKEPELVS